MKKGTSFKRDVDPAARYVDEIPEGKCLFWRAFYAEARGQGLSMADAYEWADDELRKLAGRSRRAA